MTMKRVCGWCDRDMGEKPGIDGVTHSMCQDCLEHWLTTIMERGMHVRRVRKDVSSKEPGTLIGRIVAVEHYRVMVLWPNRKTPFACRPSHLEVIK